MTNNEKLNAQDYVNLAFAQKNLELAKLKYENEQLRYQALQNSIKQSYSLTEEDKVNLDNGEIVRVSSNNPA